MNPVAPASEPPDFDRKVRQPGITFLRKNPRPNAASWRGHEYWRRAMSDLLGSYDGICSYSGSWTKRGTGSLSSILDSSVDHYLPKSSAPAKAYEWSNFRLSRARMNHRKGSHSDVLDPFRLPGRWFVLDFRSFLILPNRELSASKRTRVQRTISRLGLNSENDYVQERVDVVGEYCRGTYSWAILAAYWPFIASEMRAQHFDTKHLPSMQSAFRMP